MKIRLIKHQGNILLPADAESEAYFEKKKLGSVFEAEFTNKRNPRFHRKFFALLRVGYDLWEPPPFEDDGMREKWGAPQKDPEKFRKDLIIATGFYRPVFNLNGDMQLEAKSIAFGSMEEAEFERLYSRAIDVLLGYVPDTYSYDDINSQVNQIMQFA